jgi:hypothetical protein
MVKISELPSITTFDGTEIIPINSNTSVTSNATLTNIDNFVYPSSVTKVRTINDFPAAVGGVITLTTGAYLLDAPIVTTNRFEFAPNATVTISATNAANSLVYLGTGSLFSGTGFAGLLVIRYALIQTPAGSIFDLEGDGTLFCVDTVCPSSALLGTCRLNIQTFSFCAFSGFGDGFTFSDKIDLTLRTQVSFQDCSFNDGLNNSINIITVSGLVGVVGFLTNSFVPLSNETIFNFEESLNLLPTPLNINGNNLDIRFGGSIFSATSLRQDYAPGFFVGNTDLANSTVSIQLGFKNTVSPETTTINTTGVREIANARWESAAHERLFCQDLVTFDNAANTLTSVLIDGSTPFNHGIVDGDRIFLKAGAGASLPPELDEVTNYFVVSATANTFQLSLTLGGPAIGFSTNGTGTNYYRHNSGINASSWVVYTGLETETITVNGSATIKSTTGSTERIVEFSVVKLDSNFAITTDLDVFGVGAQATVNNTTPQGSSVNTSVTLAPEESIQFYVTNTSSTTDLQVISSNISISKV